MGAWVSYVERDDRVDRGLEFFAAVRAHRGCEHPRHVLAAVDLHYFGQVPDRVVDVRQQDALDLATVFPTLLVVCATRMHVNAGRGIGIGKVRRLSGGGGCQRRAVDRATNGEKGGSASISTFYWRSGQWAYTRKHASLPTWTRNKGASILPPPPLP